jgi:hypothetical protein
LTEALPKQEMRGTKLRNDVCVVLAHGGWADGSSWGRVITGLAAHGIKAVAAPLPPTELADDVAALNRSIERMPGPVVLAAHAYAGAVIGLARPEYVEVAPHAGVGGLPGDRAVSARLSHHAIFVW